MQSFSWDGLLPPNVAAKQTAWELRMRIRWAVHAGAKRVEIAGHLNVSSSKITQIYDGPFVFFSEIGDVQRTQFVAPATRYANAEIAVFEVIEWMRRHQPIHADIEQAERDVEEAATALANAKHRLTKLRQKLQAKS